MRLLIMNHIENARESLRSNKLRTRLTVLGITLGVACMTTIMAMGFGVSQLIDSQVSRLNGNIIIVRPGSNKSTDYFKQITESQISNAFTASPLTEKDLQAIQKVDGVEKVAPLMSVGGSLKTQHNTISDAPIIATTPELKDISQLEVHEGQFIGSVSGTNTAVVGRQMSIDLFGTDNPIGQTFKIKGVSFAVIGVLKSIHETLTYNDIDFNRSVIINLASGKSFNQGIAQIKQINIQAKKEQGAKQIVQNMRNAISKEHNGEQDFSIFSGNEISQPATKVFASITATTSVVAIVSLIIGGIGIMNIMLVSVAERTREIGIRKAVGASNSHISVQFLIESLAISFMGGVSGLVLGYFAAFIISTMLPFNPGFHWLVPVVSIGIALIVGTVFGLYPAIRAARKNPIEALRQYY
ncbi:MAG: ABC transporter permease [Candidatus Saccharibacteria bacterium]